MSAIVELSNGAQLRIERDKVGERDVAAVSYKDNIAEVLPAITGLCEDISAALESARPDKASVEFGIKLEFETSGLLAVLCSSSASADLKLTLEWSKSAIKPD